MLLQILFNNSNSLKKVSPDEMKTESNFNDSGLEQVYNDYCEAVAAVEAIIEAESQITPDIGLNESLQRVELNKKSEQIV